MKTFADHAQEKLLDLYDNHSHEVGSKLKASNPEKYKDLESTDCITYALNVLSYAFKKVGKDDAAKKVWSLGVHGTELAAYLVKEHQWKGIYINPDATHPLDAANEHTFTNAMATAKCSYYKIPLSYKVTNYKVTPKAHDAFQKVNKNSGLTKLDEVGIHSLGSVKFGFGLTRGGYHTWVFSKGEVYEVHWADIGDDLYEARPLRGFPLLSGAIIVPPDQATLISVQSKLACG